ncbi:MAG TPA: 2'-5' RNA ligase family protein [Bacillota bacterium]|nr:2'-5' RNA ligase family protein [Bacillota bacterium]
MSYGLATIFEPHEVGQEYAADKLPLHLTIIDSFETELSAVQLGQKLQELLAHQQSFTVTALSDTMYGPDKNIPVTLLELTPELASLHNKVVTMLEAEGATFKNPHFQKDRFSPHVTAQKDKRIHPGDQVVIGSICAAAKVAPGDDANRSVVAKVAFNT